MWAVKVRVLPWEDGSLLLLTGTLLKTTPFANCPYCQAKHISIYHFLSWTHKSIILYVSFSAFIMRWFSFGVFFSCAYFHSVSSSHVLIFIRGLLLMCLFSLGAFGEKFTPSLYQNNSRKFTLLMREYNSSTTVQQEIITFFHFHNEEIFILI